MKKNLKLNYFELFNEKLLIPTILVVVGFIASQLLEQYKFSETKRSANSDVFVNACQDIWSKVYAYETTMENINRDRSSLRFLKLIGGEALQAKDAKINEQLQLAETQLVELRKITDEKKFIIGENFTKHFWIYIGLVKASAEAKSNSFNETGQDAIISQEASESMHERAISMRFNAERAREYAVLK
jgi:hypothetical protein